MTYTSNLAQVATQHIIELHQWITDVFQGNSQAQPSLQRLLQHFAAEFKMVTPQGQLLNCTALHKLFSDHIGSRPDLSIEIDQIHVLFTSEHHALCHYREKQCFAGQQHTRWSCALLKINEQQISWLYLQETTLENK